MAYKNYALIFIDKKASALNEKINQFRLYFIPSVFFRSWYLKTVSLLFFLSAQII